MSKPADVSQEAWDAADITYDLETYGDGGIHHLDAQIKIARAIDTAIMAAEKRGEEREREACAQMVETFSPIRPAFETEDEGGTKWPHAAEQQPIYNPEKLAAAIRNRTAS